jgi:hypothetical protein
MRFYHHRRLHGATPPPAAPTPSDEATPTVESRPTGELPSHSTLVLTLAASDPQAGPSPTTSGDHATMKRLVAERERARAQRDAALAEVALVRAEVRRWETHHAALLDQAIARERWELKLLLGAILQEELAHGALPQTPPEECAHAARK